MKPTDKCKQDFEKWFLKVKPHIRLENEKDFVFDVDLEIFYNEPDSMQYGVLVDFYDSVDLYIIIKWGWYSSEEGFRYTSYVDTKNNSSPYQVFSEPHLTRQEARQQAIIKAKEIYNSN